MVREREREMQISLSIMFDFYYYIQTQHKKEITQENKIKGEGKAPKTSVLVRPTFGHTRKRLFFLSYVQKKSRKKK